MLNGKGNRLSEVECIHTQEKTPEVNPAVIVRLENMEKEYGTPLYLMDKRSGHLYVLEVEGYKKIKDKGLLFPSESMILAGALGKEVGEPQPSMQVSGIQTTPAAESTRKNLDS